MAFIENISLPGLCCLALFVPAAAAALLGTFLAKSSGKSGRAERSASSDE